MSRVEWMSRMSEWVEICQNRKWNEEKKKKKPKDADWHLTVVLHKLAQTSAVCHPIWTVHSHSCKVAALPFVRSKWQMRWKMGQKSMQKKSDF